MDPQPPRAYRTAHQVGRGETVSSKSALMLYTEQGSKTDCRCNLRFKHREKIEAAAQRRRPQISCPVSPAHGHQKSIQTAAQSRTAADLKAALSFSVSCKAHEQKYP